MATMFAKSSYVVIVRQGYENHVAPVIRSFDNRAIIRFHGSQCYIETTVPQNELELLGPIKTIVGKQSHGLLVSQFIEFYKKNNLNGTEPCLAKKHLNAPAWHVTVDADVKEEKILLSDYNFESPIGKIEYFESAILGFKHKDAVIYYGDDPINYVNIVCGMIIFGI